MKNYAKLIWENVIRYSLLDLFTSFFLLVAMYILIKIIFIFDNTFRIYALKSFKILALLYITAILVTSCWYHIKLLKLLVINEYKNKNSTSEKNESANNTKDERE
ncbi:MAG: hypothetical protein JW715_12015 [Sedimentisphaerales bacterium]|nr:hypothetical protein [Sedimentisphaerales bacterium]